nr:EOG090X0318 [Ilyocryptus agilis]
MARRNFQSVSPSSWSVRIKHEPDFSVVLSSTISAGTLSSADYFERKVQTAFLKIRKRNKLKTGRDQLLVKTTVDLFIPSCPSHIINGLSHSCHKQNEALLERNEKKLYFWFLIPFGGCIGKKKDIKDGKFSQRNTSVVRLGRSGPVHRLGGLERSTYRSGGGAIIEFIRPFNTCPPSGQDYLIEDGTTHIDRRMNVPAQETTYWCRVVRLPEHFNRKQHVIQFEPAIEKGRESIVHHMEVFHCEAPRDEIMPEYRGPCTDPSRPEPTRVCKRVLAAWAYGAGPFVYPPEAGLPIGGPDFNPYVMLEVHYNNPALRGDWVDSSGIRFWYTSHLRQFDAGVMELGLEYTDKMAIPPGQHGYTLTGYCLPQCTAVSLPKTGITIFGSQLHTHLLGYRVATRHFRAGKELPELDRDNHYSTHYQEIRLLARQVRVLPGDALLTTCWLNSLDKENVTLGGFSISDEMCVNYVHYFPRVDLEVCKSSVSWKALANYFKFMQEWEKQPTSSHKVVSENYKSIEWTNLRARTLMDYYNRAPISMQCNQSSGDRFPGDWEGLMPLNVPPPSPDVTNPPSHLLQQCQGEAIEGDDDDDDTDVA